MSEYAPPHVEYLESVIADCDAPLSRQDLARQILMLGAPPPCFVLPCPATRPELIAAVMMTEARLKAADLGVDLGEHLTAILYWAREPEARAMRIADVGDRVAEIAEAMVQAGRTAAQTIPEHMPHSDHANDADAALHKLEMLPCPSSGRAFGAPDRVT